MHAIFAQADGSSLVFLAVVLGFLGEGVVRLTGRMRERKQSVRAWAAGLGIASGLIACLGTISGAKAKDADDLLSGIFTGGAVGVFACMAWYFAVAVLTFGYQHFFAPPFRLLGRIRSRASERRERRREERRHLRQQRDYERGAPQRQRLAADQATAQRRRENARASCELLYKLCAPEIRDRFPRPAFDEFVRTYMTDQHDPGLVEERAEQLKGIIEQHRQRIDPPRKKLTLGQLAEWFVREKQQIESLPLDEEDKASLLAHLEAKFAKLQEKHIRSMEP
jgi:hypothetical protein